MERRLVAATILFGVVTAAQAMDCFFDNIERLAKDDAKLYSRHDEKWNLIKKNVSKSDYLGVMKSIKSSGKTFACGYTRGWIAEILQGLPSQYDEFKVKVDHGWPAAGFVNATGQKIVEIFDKNVGSVDRILYKFQIVGPLDHVWMVEQLAKGAGYRVYQSYNNAYSLKAWLAKGSLAGLQGTDIIIWHDVIKMADDFLKKYGASMSNLDGLPLPLQPLKPWLVHIRDYNLAQVEAELRKAWSVIGQGRIMDKEYFYRNYLTKLANLTEDIIPLVSTAKLWPSRLHEQWTELFGAPNPVLYPGYPFNTLTAGMSQNYALEVKPVVINASMENSCQSNANILKNSLIDCFFDTVLKLSVFDRMLNSRLEEKNRLVKSGTSKENWLNIMKKVKSSGKTYSCGFTRSWIAEVLQGLSNQYIELTLRNNSGTTAAGFLNVTGSKVAELFQKNIGSTERILYKFQIVGPLDHVWLVEQLPYDGGYRVYQSYNNAYSLKAWLAKNDLKKMHGSDIIIWHDVVRMASQYLQMHGGSMSDLNNLPSAIRAMKPWLEFIKDYNLTQVEANLKLAWTKFGQGKINTKDTFFNEYIYILGNLTQAIIPLVSTTKNWTQVLHDQWTSLFGSPNPVLFPGFPFNQLTSLYSQKYALEVKELKIDAAAEASCHANGAILERSLDCFIDGIRELSLNEKKMNTRYEKKLQLLKSSKNQSEFVDIMKDFQPYNESSFGASGAETSNWIEEIFIGLAAQYGELKREANVSTFAFLNGTGLVDLFKRKAGSWNRIIYHFEMTSNVQQVWLVDQLPYNKGYRVYMSNNDAFSLHAWLTPGNFSQLNASNLLVWKKAINNMREFLKKWSAHPSNIPAQLRPWNDFVQNYSMSDVKRNLQKAWDAFGKGMVLSQNVFFEKYLMKLGNLTDAMTNIAGTSTHWTQKLQDDWINLFGSPNPTVYPGLPYNTYDVGSFKNSSSLAYRMIEIDELTESSCPAHMSIMREFLQRMPMTSARPFTHASTTKGTTLVIKQTTVPIGSSAIGGEPAIFLVILAALSFIAFYV